MAFTMQLPIRALAVITQETLPDYLLHTGHKRGGTEARWLARCGSTVQHWRPWEADIRSGLETEVDVVRTPEYGTRDEIRMTLQTPCGLPLTLRTIWQIDGGTDVPRLITLSPDYAERGTYGRLHTLSRRGVVA